VVGHGAVAAVERCAVAAVERCAVAAVERCAVVAMDSTEDAGDGNDTGPPVSQGPLGVDHEIRSYRPGSARSALPLGHLRGGGCRATSQVLVVAARELMRV
jgi:hypothetical protein